MITEAARGQSICFTLARRSAIAAVPPWTNLYDNLGCVRGALAKGSPTKGICHVGSFKVEFDKA
jgi:hypothetical protein